MHEVEFHPTMLILFATMTGTAEDAAEMIAKRFKAAGHPVAVGNIEKYPPQKLLARNEPILFVVSTWGEGEPPDEALHFWADLSEMLAGELAGLRYAVYALGDSSYDEFCGFGRNLDLALEERGAFRLASRAECDCDHEEFIEQWCDAVNAALQNECIA